MGYSVPEELVAINAREDAVASHPYQGLFGDSNRSRSSSVASLQSNVLDELELVSERVARAAASIEKTLVKIQTDIRRAAQGAHQRPVSAGRSFRTRDDSGSASDQSTPKEKNVIVRAGSSSSPGAFTLEQGSIESVESFDPFNNLRFRLDLRPTDPDYVSSVHDTYLRDLFKHGLGCYIRQTLFRYQSELSLEKLKEIGRDHARYCIKKISSASKNQRRYLLKFGASIEQQKEDGFIGGLERLLRQEIAQGPPSSQPQGWSLCETADSQAVLALRNPVLDSTSAAKPLNCPPVPAYLPAKALRPNIGRTLPHDTESGISRNTKGGRTIVTNSRYSPSSTSGRHELRVSQLQQRREYAAIRTEMIAALSQMGNRSSLIRWRELGIASLDGFHVHERHLTRQLQSLILRDLRPWRQWETASKDILCVQWSSDGKDYAIGASTNFDSSNLQYNERRNLLYGDLERNEIYELDDHKIDRPRPESIYSGGNATRDMYNSLDPYVYATVTGVCFDRARQNMYTSSYDKTVKVWDTSKEVQCIQTITHSSRVQLLDHSLDSSMLATGQDSSSNSIHIYRTSNGTAHSITALNSERAQQYRLTPTSLKFGNSNQSKHLLLAGFGEDRNEYGVQDRDGDLLLWDLSASAPARLKVSSGNRNIFDLTWHPRYQCFAAGLPVKVGDVQAHRSGIKSNVCTWNPSQSFSRIFELDCPALDINEVLFHPFRDSFISASCTDGATYVWDCRKPTEYVVRLQHGEPLDVIDDQLVRDLGYARAREEADTGVKFVSWDDAGHFIYTGSSDGLIKQWNPWVASENSHVRDVISYDSHVMAGSFSPDKSHLLVGTGKGTIHILSSAPLTDKTSSENSDDTDTTILENIKFIPAKGSTASDNPPDSTLGTEMAKEMIATGKIIIYPGLGAGKGPLYNGPFASWARTGVERSNLALAELDPDVLASQIHPVQWKKGMELGGTPTISSKERRDWLVHRARTDDNSGNGRRKRPRDILTTNATPATSQHPMLKRPRADPEILEDRDMLTPVDSFTDNDISQAASPTFSGPRQPSHPVTESGINTPKKPLTYKQGIPEAAPSTPTSPSVHIKQSPHSASKLPVTPRSSSQPRAQFVFPRSIVPGLSFPSRTKDHFTASSGPVTHTLAKETLRAHNRQVAAAAQSKGELIVLDDD